VIDKIKDFQEVIASRFNNVIVGSLVLSSIMMNARGILIFIYSDKDAKLGILRNWKLDVFNDLIIPIGLALFYLVVIPLVSAFIKKNITNEIYKREQEAEREKILISLSGMQEVAVATVKSTSEYADEITKHEIQEWLNERDAIRLELQEIKSENILLKNNIEIKTREESRLSTSLTYYSMLYERCIDSLRQVGRSINETNEITQNVELNDNNNRYTEKSNENKYFIIKQLGNALKQAFEVNNARPASTFGDWEQPIPTTLTKALESMLAKLDHEKTNHDASMHMFTQALRKASTTNTK